MEKLDLHGKTGFIIGGTRGIGNAIARARKTGADDDGPIPAVGPLGGDPE